MIKKQVIRHVQEETPNATGVAEFSCIYNDVPMVVNVVYTTDEDVDGQGLKELRIRRVDKWVIAPVAIAAIKAVVELLKAGKAEE